jgi:hypothetical protein
MISQNLRTFLPDVFQGQFKQDIELRVELQGNVAEEKARIMQVYV